MLNAKFGVGERVETCLFQNNLEGDISLFDHLFDQFTIKNMDK